MKRSVRGQRLGLDHLDTRCFGGGAVSPSLFRLSSCYGYLFVCDAADASLLCWNMPPEHWVFMLHCFTNAKAS